MSARSLSSYTHIEAAVLDDQPDGRPGRYYVSVRDGSRWALLYGPFGRHADALAAVDAARAVALAVDPRAHFFSFGTARAAEEWIDSPPGILNALLPPIAAEPSTEEYHATVD